MLSIEIIRKAITKATENGWNNALLWHVRGSDGSFLTTQAGSLDRAKSIARQHKDSSIEPEIDSRYPWEAMVYNHNFAKAFWGEKWQSHLQAMVLAEDPIKYLEKCL